MSLYKRKDSPFYWVKFAPIKGEVGPFFQSTGTTRKRDAQRYHDKLQALLRKTQRDLGNVDWRHQVPRLLKEALQHLQARQSSERDILVEVHACLERLIDEEHSGAVDALLRRFVVVPVPPATRARLTDFLARALGTADLQAARSYLEEPLRQTLHLILALPEYQLS